MRALLSHYPSCTLSNSLAGGLQACSLSTLFKSYLPFKRTPDKAFCCQVQKPESDGCSSAEHDSYFLFDSNHNDEFSKSETENLDPLPNGLHRDNERHDEAWASNQKYDAECHVEAISWRERRITASVVVDASPERVWDVLTDYERLVEFIPNLVCSKKIPCPYHGRIWLLQRGLQRMMYWNIEAHVVLDLREFPDLETGSELHFFMVDGDFKRYDGKWYLRSGPRLHSTRLHYEVNVVPKIIFAAAFVENIIKADLPRNLCAIAKRAEAESVSDFEISKIANKHASQKSVHTDCLEEVCAVINKSTTDLHWSGFGRACKLGSQFLADEIHFRRLDDLLENGGVHRQVAASITVKASSKEVWNVLTAYEDLPEFVPNLTNSKVLSREGNRVRLLQEGCKCLLYMVLHAQVTLDLWEQPEEEISFKQVVGDFKIFQGKWTLRRLGSQHTVLKYAVDTQIWKDCILAESLVEEVIYEDLPANLCAIRDRAESLANCLTAPPVFQEENSTEESPSGDTAALGNDRAPVRALMDDFSVLEKELKHFIAEYGVNGVMPKRKHMRRHGRNDLGNAITAMGGFRAVAARMKLSLSYEHRKPRGFWDDVQNLRNEVLAAQKELGCDPSVLPSRLSLERLGRYDVARVLEKWGGAKETARILGLKPMGRKKKESSKKQTSAKVDKGPELVANKPLLSLDSAAALDAVKEEAKRDENDDNFLLKVSLRPRVTFLEEGSVRKQEAAAANGNQEASQQMRPRVVSHPLGNKDAAPNPANDSFPSLQVKEKKMPYKTGVPQESSKWLTLFTSADDKLHDVND